MAHAIIKLLSDGPAATDSTGPKGEGSHERVAQAITSLIRDSNEAGKAIAVIGSWGSGKSTVVRFVKDELRTEDTKIFEFDAWAHQDDPPRRAFLEALLQFLLDQVYQGTEDEGEFKSTFQAKIDRITGRTESSNTTTSKQITFLGVVSAILFLICLPLSNLVSARFGSGHAIGLVVLVASIGLLGVLISVIVQWRKEAGAGPVSILTASHPKPQTGVGENLLRFFIRDAHEMKTSSTEKAADATSVEFRKVFDEMITMVVPKPVKRLVIVVENLDRVDAQKAVSIWSTMRIFFELDDRQWSWKDHFWLIAPFDPASLRRLWTSDKDPALADTLVDSFINKTFQVTFRVPPPVLTGWRDFFEQRFQEAFLEPARQDEWETVYRLYDRLNERLSYREIKLFINKLAVLYLQWKSIPLPYLAVYILVSAKYGDRFMEMLIGRSAGETDKPTVEFVTAAALELLPAVAGGQSMGAEEWKMYLAAIHFNVEPDRALQVLIADELRTSLSSSDRDKLKTLSTVPGFWIVCRREIEERLPKIRGTAALVDLILILQEVVPKGEHEEDSATGTMELLLTRAAQLKEWDLGVIPKLQPVMKLASKRSYEEFRGNAISGAKRIPKEVDKSWIAGLSVAVESLQIDANSGFELVAQNANEFVRAKYVLLCEGKLPVWPIASNEELEKAIPSAVADELAFFESGYLQPLLEALDSSRNSTEWENLRERWIESLFTRPIEFLTTPKLIALIVEGVLSFGLPDRFNRRRLFDAFSRVDAKSAASANQIGTGFCAIACELLSKGSEPLTNTPGGYEGFLSAVNLSGVRELLISPGLHQDFSAPLAQKAILELAGRGVPLSAEHFLIRYRAISKVLTREEVSQMTKTLIDSGDLISRLATRRLRVSLASVYRAGISSRYETVAIACFARAVLAEPASYIVRAIETVSDFQELFEEVQERTGGAWMSKELLAAIVRGLGAAA